jgi:hypothetical protein
MKIIKYHLMVLCSAAGDGCDWEIGRSVGQRWGKKLNLKRNLVHR